MYFLIEVRQQTANQLYSISLCSMRVMNIRVLTGAAGLSQLKASWRNNWRHYLQEAAGLAIFMISACFFGAMLESPHSSWHVAIPNGLLRLSIMGVLMGGTALFIFYSPFTSPSGSQINSAVTITFWRLGKMCHWDAVFYIVFQVTGGTLAVFIMQMILDGVLVEPPINSVATIPGKYGWLPALFMELSIAFVTMSIVLFTSAHPVLSKYTRFIAAGLVCCWVIIAGPISGFGMNPARTLASAIPGNSWSGWWMYMIAPVAGMLLASELFLLVDRFKSNRTRLYESKV
jgi:aquaporin Z